MAFNFDSGQFNKESTPKRLGNWQVPRWAPTRARPLEMRPNPKPICDINGHFLPGAPRGSSKCFGHYTGTWELPRKITRKVAEELAKEPPDGRFPDWLNLRVQRPKAIAGRLRAGKRGKAKPEDKKPAEDQTFNDEDQVGNKETRDKDEPDEVQDNNNEDDPLALNSEKEPVDSDGHGPYIPGSKTDPEKRHENYDLLVKDAVDQLHGPQENKTDKFWRKVADKAQKDNEIMKYAKKSETPKLPYVNVSQNFNFAKKMHAGNLEHEPLPDTLGYRNLTKVGEHRESDIVVKPYAIGWKGFGASGPTCCTKMRVHRPKTCDPKKTEGEEDKRKQRPATSDLGGQYKKPLSLMDLAICWDFKADNPKNEARPPKHIDGSNGSLAPAVFTMVHTPKEDVHETVVGHAFPIFTQNRQGDDAGKHSVPYFEKDITKEKRKDSCDVQHCPQHNEINKSSKSRSSSRKSSAQSNKSICDGINGCGTTSDVSRNGSHESRPQMKHIKEAWNSESRNKNSKYDINRNRHSLESYEKTPLAQGKLHQSSPNESDVSRHTVKDSLKNSDTSNNTKHKNCLSCNGVKMPQEKRQKDDYKFAFKAGNPNSVQSNSSNDSKDLKIPKMRHPYTKKSYTIPTLAPPFSIWRDANATGYPEHWRLASVYQHAYKPLEQRRKPLIESVYQ
ncbi:uncharacterized protein LOC120631494 [Pararge aegeria]|uniref:uncharacterized protein LOC120631494 n=1 Tax=Pararge aegeria TaxID=116150 RepID=UPI0019D108F1|nr:uncharacterized protein LOC120631494 [Pararge aegeria]